VWTDEPPARPPRHSVFQIEIKDGVCTGVGKDKWAPPHGARSGNEFCYVRRRPPSSFVDPFT
jgi:hypothetical protein